MVWWCFAAIANRPFSAQQNLTFFFKLFFILFTLRSPCFHWFQPHLRVPEPPNLLNELLYHIAHFKSLFGIMIHSWLNHCKLAISAEFKGFKLPSREYVTRFSASIFSWFEPSWALIIGVKYFRIQFRFRREIRIFKHLLGVHPIAESNCGVRIEKLRWSLIVLMFFTVKGQSGEILLWVNTSTIYISWQKRF